ncbi:hypothetical protein [Pseudomonas sp. CFBP 13602]|nr:hypothetical protein [Pseudomonas sp. CFBP 13602]MBD8825647.1 hypothetical protein [Pseudomonas sp. CFBP 13602]
MSCGEDNQLGCTLMLFAAVAGITIAFDDKISTGLRNCFFVVQRAVR